VAITGWIGTTSGLPSLLVDGPYTVTADDRVLARLGAGRHLLADALAAPGVEVVYGAGGDTVSLTRPVGDWYGVYVAGRDGRSVPELAYEGNGDPLEWKPGASTAAGVTRWAIRDEPVTGTGVLVVGVIHEPALWGVLRQHHPIMLIPSAPTAGVPPRVVIVTSVNRKRLGDELVEVTIGWSEHTAAVGAVPVTTWGEWRAWGEAHPAEAGWRAWSAIEVARRVQGMP